MTWSLVRVTRWGSARCPTRRRCRSQLRRDGHDRLFGHAKMAESPAAVRLSVVSAASADGDGAAASTPGARSRDQPDQPERQCGCHERRQDSRCDHRPGSVQFTRTLGRAVGVGMSSIVVLHQVRADRSIGCSLAGPALVNSVTATPARRGQSSGPSIRAGRVGGSTEGSDEAGSSPPASTSRQWDLDPRRVVGEGPAHDAKASEDRSGWARTSAARVWLFDRRGQLAGTRPIKRDGDRAGRGDDPGPQPTRWRCRSWVPPASLSTKEGPAGCEQPDDVGQVELIGVERHHRITFVAARSTPHPPGQCQEPRLCGTVTTNAVLSARAGSPSQDTRRFCRDGPMTGFLAPAHHSPGGIDGSIGSGDSVLQAHHEAIVSGSARWSGSSSAIAFSVAVDLAAYPSRRTAQGSPTLPGASTDPSATTAAARREHHRAPPQRHPAQPPHPGVGAQRQARPLRGGWGPGFGGPGGRGSGSVFGPITVSAINGTSVAA